MKILAYADRVSARPGEVIEFKVSCEGVARYDVQIVRVVQGDTNPDGPGYREEVVPLDLGGPFDGRFQPLRVGSYAQVDDHPAFKALSSFTIVLALWPTTPGQGTQTLVARRDSRTGQGFELYLDASGAPAFTLSAHGPEPVTVSTEKPLLSRRWCVVGASYDATTGTLLISQFPLEAGELNDRQQRVSPIATGVSQTAVSADLTLSARSTGNGTERHFNGRLDNPRLFSRAMAIDEMVPAYQIEIGGQWPVKLVAAWDFSLEIPSQRIVDRSPNHLHGNLVNLPTRGVTGHRWCARSFNWAERPEDYSAIHFHDDDLYDAGWSTGFSVEIPETFHSGVYAARMHSDDAEYYVPFCVLPPEGTTTARAVFLLPNASYMAYANNRIGLDVPETELVTGRLLELTEADCFMQEHPELGLCFYDVHNDDSGVYYSSRLRPIVNMQPKFVGKLGGFGSNLWQFNADTHILGWLEQTGQSFDVVTDEDLHREGLSLISGYQLVLTGSHPEYYSEPMLDAVQAYTERGGRLMYLGGNGFYWRISYHPRLPGVIECRKSEVGIRSFPPGPGEFFASFTGEYTGLWRRNGRAPNRLVGVGMVSQGFDVSFPFRRTEASHDERVGFIFEGLTGELIGDFGLGGGGAAGMEVDAMDHDLGTPSHALVVASAEMRSDIYLMTPEDILDPAPGLGGCEAEGLRADMVFFETGEGGAVFSTGSIAWASSMAWNAYDNDVARLTENVLNRFLNERPF